METPKELWAKVFQEFNGNDRAMSQALQEHLKREHPTLQQLFWGAIQDAAMLQATFHTDLRNEATGKMVKRWTRETEFLPFI